MQVQQWLWLEEDGKDIFNGNLTHNRTRFLAKVRTGCVGNYYELLVFCAALSRSPRRGESRY